MCKIALGSPWLKVSIREFNNGDYQRVPSCHPISTASIPLGIKLPPVSTATTKDDKISMNFIVKLNFDKVVDRYNNSLSKEESTKFTAEDAKQLTERV
jgi:hypothetical protein